MNDELQDMNEDWVEVELGEVCTYSKGKKPKVLQVTKSKDIDIPYVNIKAFEKGIFDQYTNGEKCNLCEDDDLLMVWDGARAGFTGKAKKGAVGSTLMKIEEIKGVEKNYLFYFLLSLYTKINTNPKGVGIPHVEPRILWGSKMLIVNKHIQRAIVSKIESLFSDLDNGIASFKKAQEQLKIYRQAVLKKAFEGELTKEWREKAVKAVKKIHEFSLPTAEELLKQIKEERQNHYNQLIKDWEKAVKDWEAVKKNHDFFQKPMPKKPNKPKAPKELPPLTEDELKELPKLPENWEWVKSGEFFSFITSGSRGWAKYYSERGSIFIRITNLNFDTLNLDLREEKIQYVNPPQNSEGLRTKVQEGDFLFSITGYLGMFAISPKLESAFVNQHVCLCRPKKSFNKKYLAYWIIAKSGGHYYLNQNQKGAVKAGLNLDDLKTFPVPLPPSLPEQHQIVKEIETRLSVCDKVEQSISESLEKAKALRQSILKKAFEGWLLSEAEVAACKQEKDYEPASELLKKIKATRKENSRVFSKIPKEASQASSKTSKENSRVFSKTSNKNSQASSKK